ncbi:sensor histidine kinase [Anaerosporobacter sp.]|uniref:sensor histidine kinase n=1 Tax=Anaerosporobacter sp. TaxID=1872529 RepID=UPI00286EED79|nr:HAMP domain-containing sensor histidine kinase [Anaerosporobacter sp.]
MFGKRKNEYKILNQMLDDAIAGRFEETTYNESELSKLQTKWKQYLTSARMSEKKLEKERENLKELITNISHQTKTPLTNVLLYAQLLEEQSMDEVCKEYVEEIVTYSKKLDILLQSLVKMSRLETGVFQFVCKKDSLQKLALSVVNMGKVKATEKEITIVCSFDYEKDCENTCENEIKAVYDSKWTVEAIYNILDNAIKYSEPKTEIEVSIFRYELFAGIQIKDAGLGISEEEIPRIFGRFYRGEQVHDKTGIGVGLYLSREIIEGQGGYIKVVSEVGEGSSFQIFLPV